MLVEQRHAFEQFELRGRRGRRTGDNLFVVPRAVVCPDKFRGTLGAGEVAHAMAAGVRRAGYEEVVELPLADGGEGTLATLLAA
ncbi:MAG TPA: glycerate kinase, partial [Acidimicrobiia bacterium]|nr:glycerate kinase [Acidimicrobiia bacterium]